MKISELACYMNVNLTQKSKITLYFFHSYSWVKIKDPWRKWKNSLITLFSMVTTQLTGVIMFVNMF